VPVNISGMKCFTSLDPVVRTMTGAALLKIDEVLL
jgi:hypothetical protein